LTSVSVLVRAWVPPVPFWCLGHLAGSAMGPACREHLVRTCALAGCSAMKVRWEVAPFKERQYRDDPTSRWP
jgi:hypothetical protein